MKIRIFVILLPFLLLSCSQGKQHEQMDTSASTTTSSGAKVLTVEPSATRSKTSEIKKDDSIQAEALSEKHKDQITAKDSLPSIVKAKIIPAKSNGKDILRMDIIADDKDDDPVSFKYRWAKNGVPSGNDEFIKGPFKRGDKISVKITPYDGKKYGQPVIVRTTLENTPPKILLNGKESFDGISYTYQIKALDADGDTLAFKLTKAPKGMKIDEKSGLIRWKVPPGTSGSIPVEVKVSDGHGGGSIYSFEVVISREGVSGK